MKKFFLELKARWKAEIPTFWKNVRLAWGTISVLSAFVVSTTDPTVAGNISSALGVPEDVITNLNFIKDIFPGLITPSVVLVAKVVTAIGIAVIAHIKFIKKDDPKPPTP